MEFVDKFRKNVTIDYFDVTLVYSHQAAYTKKQLYVNKLTLWMGKSKFDKGSTVCSRLA